MRCSRLTWWASTAALCGMMACGGTETAIESEAPDTGTVAEGSSDAVGTVDADRWGTNDVEEGEGTRPRLEDAHSASTDSGPEVDAEADAFAPPLPDSDEPDVDVSDEEVSVPSGPPPDLGAPYYALDRVLEVDITLAPEDWEALRNETRTLADFLGGDCMEGPPEQPFTWFPATVTVDGVTVTEAGVRKKGFLGSMNTEKPSLKVRFDKYVEDQMLEEGEEAALQWLTLNNAQQDASKLNTCLSYHVWAATGRPAPRCNFATVSVNGTPMGIYVHVESIKDALIAQHFDDVDGNLYEGTLSDFRAGWTKTLDKKTNTAEGDWSDIQGITEALSDPSPAGLQALSQHLHIEHFITHWALEVLVAHWDGYAGNRNNFYLYGEPGKPLVFIPWGADSSFQPFDHPFTEINDPQGVVANGAIAHRLYQDPLLRGAYVARMKELLDTVWDEEVLNALIDTMATIVQTYGHPDEVGWAAEDTLRVRNFVNGRRQAVLADLQPTPIEWPWPVAEANICWEVLGQVDVSFETTWGTLEVEDFMGTGGGEVAMYSVEGADKVFDDIGITSGPGQGVAIINIIHSEIVNGAVAYEVLSLYVPYGAFSEGTIVMNQWEAPGHRIRFDPPFYEAQYLARIDSGAIILEQAAVTGGGPVKGRVYGTLYSFGGYESGTGSVGEITADIGVVINEVATKGEPLDWFELYNTSTSPVDLSNLLLADSLTDETKRVPFPEGLMLAPGAYLVLELDKEGWPGFALGGDEELGIWTSEGVLVDSAQWATGFSGAGTTYARIPDITGSFVPGQTPTPGAANTP